MKKPDAKLINHQGPGRRVGPRVEVCTWGIDLEPDLRVYRRASDLYPARPGSAPTENIDLPCGAVDSRNADVAPGGPYGVGVADASAAIPDPHCGEDGGEER